MGEELCKIHNLPVHVMNKGSTLMHSLSYWSLKILVQQNTRTSLISSTRFRV